MPTTTNVDKSVKTTSTQDVTPANQSSPSKAFTEITKNSQEGNFEGDTLVEDHQISNAEKPADTTPQQSRGTKRAREGDEDVSEPSHAEKRVRRTATSRAVKSGPSPSTTSGTTSTTASGITGEDVASEAATVPNEAASSQPVGDVVVKDKNNAIDPGLYATLFPNSRLTFTPESIAAAMNAPPKAARRSNNGGSGKGAAGMFGL